AAQLAAHHVAHAGLGNFHLLPGASAVFGAPPLCSLVRVDAPRRLAIELDAVELRIFSFSERRLNLRPGAGGILAVEADAQLREDRARSAGRRIDLVDPACAEAAVGRLKGLAAVGALEESRARRPGVHRSLFRRMECHTFAVPVAESAADGVPGRPAVGALAQA